MPVALEGHSDFIIFFDDQQVQRFVKSFSTNVSTFGSQGEATIELVFSEAFLQIEYLTDVRIFVRNMFSGKFRMVFDGQLHNRRVSITQHNKSIVFTAYDYTFWMERIPVPILFSVEHSLNQLQSLSWAAKGINHHKVEFILPEGDMVLAGKNLEETIRTMFQKIDDAMVYHAGATEPDYNNIYSWTGLSSRIRIISDVDRTLRENNVVDFVYDGSYVENMAVFLNGIISKLGYEMYQDIDAIIKLKEPFWYEGILKNFVIDPLLVIDMNEVTNWDAECSRVLVVGGADEMLSGDMDPMSRSMYTPAGVYIGESGFYTTMEDVFAYDVPTNHPQPYIKSTPSSESDAGRNRVVSYALRQVGKRYVSGGGHGTNWLKWETTQGGLDCSGLVSVAYHEAGYKISSLLTWGLRDAARQIPPSQIRLGDLGFSNNYGHVGIYCGYNAAEGKHWWVHASSPTRGIVLDKTNDVQGFWTNGIYDLASVLEGGYVGPAIAIPNTTAHYPLTELTDRERRFGINLAELYQPLIRIGLDGDNTTIPGAYSNIKKYAQYMYDVINATATTASITLTGSPWLRPGFNMWLDPTGISRIYYINSVSHSGDGNGVYTSLGLVYGRSEEQYKGHYKQSTGKNPFTLTKHIDSSEYFVPESEDNLAVVNPDKMDPFKEYAENINQSLKGRGALTAYNSPFRDWYGKDFIRRNTTFLGRWDTEFNQVELQCMIGAGYKRVTKDYISNLTVGRKGINPITPSDYTISDFAKFVAEYALDNAYPPDFIQKRTERLAQIISSADKETSIRYIQSR